MASDQSPRVEITSANFDDRQKQFKFDFYIPSGIQGERGEKFYVNDRVDTVDNLPTSAVKGDAYFVVADNHIYQWNGEKWVDLGLAQEGPKGTDGTNGRDGRDGEAAIITIAETRTGEAGTEAKVEELVDSTAQNRKYRITIPKGADGRDGTDGVDALIYQAIYGASIESGSSVTIAIDQFSRTPVVNETFVLFTSLGQYSIATIESIDNNTVTAVCGDVVTIKGADGKDGLSIVNITKGSVTVDDTTTTTSIIFTFSDQSTKTVDVVVQNGKDGTNGRDGVDGRDGTTFTPSVDLEGNLSWTNDGGKVNPPTVKIVGKDGKDGKTPVKGEDYWTEADKTEMVDDTIEEIKNRGLISGNGNLAMAYAETVVNADGTTTLKIVDDVNL